MLMGKRPFDSGSKDQQKLRLAIAQGEYERVPTERCSGGALQVESSSPIAHSL
jgi:hypothetical protein